MCSIKSKCFYCFPKTRLSIQFPPRVCMLDQSVYREKAPPPILRHTIKSHVDVTITDLIVCLWFLFCFFSLNKEMNILVSTSAQSQSRPDVSAQNPQSCTRLEQVGLKRSNVPLWRLTLCWCVSWVFCCKATFHPTDVRDSEKNKTNKQKEWGGGGDFPPLWWLSDLRRLWRWTENLADGLARSRPWTEGTRIVGGGPFVFVSLCKGEIFNE